jgi:5-methylcytosine-specific restriction enzyme subunit McrC
MPRLVLTEYEQTLAVELPANARDLLRDAFPDLEITPTKGREGLYDLTPGAHIGVAEVAEWIVEVRPKIAFGHLMFVLSYALDPAFWQATRTVDFGDARSLVEAIVPTFVHHLRRALRRGVLQGYRQTDERTMFIRGRIRFADQLKGGRPGPLPIEISYDDFTEDILENRLLRSAIKRLSRLTLRSKSSRVALRELDTALELVSQVEFDSRRVPQVQYTRANAHYRYAVELARWIIRKSSVELGPGLRDAVSFVVNMNDSFENFVVVALREALALSPFSFPQNASGRIVLLDQVGRIHLEPDLSWWESGECLFVGDVKYKRLSVAGFKHPDIYQMLAYLTALQLEAGVLVYAAGAGPEPSHELLDGKQITVVSLDLAQPPVDVLAQVQRVALLVRGQRDARLSTAA